MVSCDDGDTRSMPGSTDRTSVRPGERGRDGTARARLRVLGALVDFVHSNITSVSTMY